jgi:xanthine dehydrogenase YagT iron-sulfur-binding subunit
MRRDDSDMPPAPALSPAGSARRQFLIDTGALATGAAAATRLQAAQPPANPAIIAPAGSAATHLRLIVNGRSEELDLEPRVTLLDALRGHLGLAGTKKGCDRGQCGACTVLVNGRRINSCMTLALTHEGDEVVTIEGLGNSGMLHPMQQAFLVHDGYQCGYCTPGQICSAVAMLDEARAGAASAATGDVRASGPVPLTDDEIRERMSGNLCRCGAYVGIVASVRAVAGTG